MLQGDRFVNNSNQVVPFKRMSNLDFYRYQYRAQKFQQSSQQNSDLQTPSFKSLLSSKFSASSGLADPDYLKRNLLYKESLLSISELSEEYETVEHDIASADKKFKTFCQNVKEAKENLGLCFVDGMYDRTSLNFFNKLKTTLNNHKSSASRFRPAKIDKRGYVHKASLSGPKLEIEKIQHPDQIPNKDKKSVSKITNYTKYIKKRNDLIFRLTLKCSEKKLRGTRSLRPSAS